MSRQSACHQLLIAIFIALLMSANGFPQTGKPDDPGEVVRKYRVFDSAGNRVNKEGWLESGKYFLKPLPAPLHVDRITVIEGERVTYTKITGTTAEVSVGSNDLGTIDASGRFSNQLIFGKKSKKDPQLPALNLYGPAPMIRSYQLVLTGEYWILTKNQQLKAVNGSKTWKILNFETEPRITVQAAIEYLNRLKVNSKSNTVRNNAELSLEKLTKGNNK